MVSLLGPFITILLSYGCLVMGRSEEESMVERSGREKNREMVGFLIFWIERKRKQVEE